jgi:hypothetical protein
VEEYGRARQARNDNIIQRVRFACRTVKSTDIHNCYTNASQCYVICTLPVLFVNVLCAFRQLPV